MVAVWFGHMVVVAPDLIRNALYERGSMSGGRPALLSLGEFSPIRFLLGTGSLGFLNELKKNDCDMKLMN